MGRNTGQDVNLNQEYYFLLGTGDTLAGTTAWILDDRHLTVINVVFSNMKYNQSLSSKSCLETSKV